MDNQENNYGQMSYGNGQPVSPSAPPYGNGQPVPPNAPPYGNPNPMPLYGNSVPPNAQPYGNGSNVPPYGNGQPMQQMPPNAQPYGNGNPNEYLTQPPQFGPTNFGEPENPYAEDLSNEPSGNSGGGKKKKTLLWTLVAIGVLVLGAVGFFFLRPMLGFGKSSVEKAVSKTLEKSKETLPLLKLSDIISNISDNQQLYVGFRVPSKNYALELEVEGKKKESTVYLNMQELGDPVSVSLNPENVAIGNEVETLNIGLKNFKENVLGSPLYNDPSGPLAGCTEADLDEAEKSIKEFLDSYSKLASLDFSSLKSAWETLKDDAEEITTDTSVKSNVDCELKSYLVKGESLAKFFKDGIGIEVDKPVDDTLVHFGIKDDMLVSFILSTSQSQIEIDMPTGDMGEELNAYSNGQLAASLKGSCSGGVYTGVLNNGAQTLNISYDSNSGELKADGVASGTKLRISSEEISLENGESVFKISSKIGNIVKPGGTVYDVFNLNAGELSGHTTFATIENLMNNANSLSSGIVSPQEVLPYEEPSYDDFYEEPYEEPSYDDSFDDYDKPSYDDSFDDYEEPSYDDSFDDYEEPSYDYEEPSYDDYEEPSFDDYNSSSDYDEYESDDDYSDLLPDVEESSSNDSYSDDIPDIDIPEIDIPSYESVLD